VVGIHIFQIPDFVRIRAMTDRTQGTVGPPRRLRGNSLPIIGLSFGAVIEEADV
jgi:hypothetical protein